MVLILRLSVLILNMLQYVFSVRNLFPIDYCYNNLTENIAQFNHLYK